MIWPSFSIVIPTYQRREVVSDCVRALSTLDYAGAIEVLVVVDGSTDGTAEDLRQMAAPFPLRIMSQENAGAAAARNRGASEALNDILLFLDDDMMCRPDMLSQHARMIADGADAVIGHVPLEAGSAPGFLSHGVALWAEERAERLAHSSRLTLFDLLTGQLSVRRSVFEQIGGFDQRFTASGTYGDEDLDLGARLTEQFDVRFNRDAISYQRYVVTPAEHMQQWYHAGMADVAFARKHPTRARELLELHDARSWQVRLLLRPFASVPLLPRLAMRAAVSLATREQRMPAGLRPWAARFFYAARAVGYWTGVRDAGGVPASRQALVLCYHAISDLTGDPVLAEYGISPETFAQQLDSLHSRGFRFASPQEIVALIENQVPLPAKSVLLTFDDCYEELPEIARNLLEPRGIRAIAFAVSGMSSDTNEWDQAVGARTMRLLDADGLRLLSSRGVEIGCHSSSHRPLPSVPHDELGRETRAAADELARLGLPWPRFFAYPYGAQDGRSRAAVQSAGFKAGFGLSARRLSPASDRFALPRIEILARDGLLKFRLKTRWPRLSVYVLNGPAVARAAIGRKVRRLLRNRATAELGQSPA